jgi:hypothetical protein
MKKFLAIAMIAATLTSCGGGESKEGEATDTTTVAPATETPATVDTTAAATADTTAKVAADTTKKPN